MTDEAPAPGDGKSDEVRATRRRTSNKRVVRDDGVVYESITEAALANGCSQPLISRSCTTGKTAKGRVYSFEEKEAASDEERKPSERDGGEGILDAGACKSDRDSSIDDGALPERGAAEAGSRADDSEGPGHAMGGDLRATMMKCPLKFNGPADGDERCDASCAWIVRVNGQGAMCCIAAIGRLLI